MCITYIETTTDQFFWYIIYYIKVYLNSSIICIILIYYKLYNLYYCELFILLASLKYY